ncbi:hypothetical protein SAMN05421810_10476 [Amycolatopsis arida]|uniref:Uncharacterized protein n=1 Tax=Amycolatopsis arida TaxID=587909 RepID=A0A1I5UQM6_9PSEU|nr:hypothetical protein [Amycolatopsis arida]TDX90996.1 hypothetical protein CLV69_10675 [Amycolatopsis arida]SFP97490.1 hypothetical protein SAMN05421810_10476 [Amycolatopsis arida]
MTLAVLAVVLLPDLLGGGDPRQDRVAELRAAERARDAELTRELVGLAEAARAKVVPVLGGLDEPAASTDRVAEWRAAVDAAAERFAARPSGGTAVNLARSGLAGAITTLGRAVEVYELASTTGETADEAGERSRALARSLRDDAVVAWSVAANQLDVAGIEAGIGHVHVFLPPRGLPGELTEHGQG